MPLRSATPSRILIRRSRLRRRVRELATAIRRDYRGKPLTVIAVLKGSFIFMADLVRDLDLPMRMEFVTASSYGAARRSSGHVRVRSDLPIAVRGRHVLILEDIVDTGRTLAAMRRSLSRRNPLSIRSCALLDKPEARRVPVPVEYVGFRIRPDFVVGYGLDHAERWRHLPHLAVLPGKRSPK